MNVVITLPKNLLDMIISGKKNYEMRKCMPKNLRVGVDGFFVVEKGTDKIRCWCRVDKINETYIDHYSIDWYISRLCVPAEYIEKYANGKKVCLWKIGKVHSFKYKKLRDLALDRNPQQFTYTPFSYGDPLDD